MQFAGASRLVPILLSVLALSWGILTGAHGLVAITAVLVTIWLSHLAVDSKTTRDLMIAIVQHEDLLCTAWRLRALAVRFPDGRSLLADSGAA